MSPPLQISHPEDRDGRDIACSAVSPLAGIAAVVIAQVLVLLLR